MHHRSKPKIDIEDILEKRESFSKSLRIQKKAKILKNKRSNEIPAPEPSSLVLGAQKLSQFFLSKSIETTNNPYQLKVSLQNMQSIFGEEKYLNSKKWLNSPLIENSDVIFMTETRTRKDFFHEDHTVIQTKKAMQGGIIQISKNKHTQRNIKFVHQNITYSQIYHNHCLVHLIGIYFPPVKNEHTTANINHLYWILDNILDIDHQAQILVAGDFNFHLKKIQKRLSNYGLRGILPDSEKTHTKGNLLDQIFTNGVAHFYSVSDP